MIFGSAVSKTIALTHADPLYVSRHPRSVLNLVIPAAGVPGLWAEFPTGYFKNPVLSIIVFFNVAIFYP
jgi:hypothetical protein